MKIMELNRIENFEKFTSKKYYEFSFLKNWFIKIKYLKKSIYIINDE